LVLLDDIEFHRWTMGCVLPEIREKLARRTRESRFSRLARQARQAKDIFIWVVCDPAGALSAMWRNR
jgi:hypothetical protein